MPLTIVLMRHLPGRRSRNVAEYRPGPPRGSAPECLATVDAGPGPAGRRRGSALAGDGDRRDRRGRPPPASTAAQADSVAPVVMTSSTSTTQRPRTAWAAAVGRIGAPKAPATFAARSRPIELELGDRRPPPLEDGRRRQAQRWPPRPRRAGRPGRSRAARPARRGPGPARGGRHPRRPPPSAARPPRRAARRAVARRRTSAGAAPSRTTPPNGAHHSTWSSGGGSSAGRPIGTPGRQRRAVRRARGGRPAQIGVALAAAAGAGRREREVEAARDQPTARHRPSDDRPLLHPALIRRRRVRRALEADRGRRRPCRSGRSCPTGSSSAPWAPRTSGTMPRQGRSARWTATTSREPSSADRAGRRRRSRSGSA